MDMILRNALHLEQSKSVNSLHLNSAEIGLGTRCGEEESGAKNSAFFLVATKILQIGLKSKRVDYRNVNFPEKSKRVYILAISIFLIGGLNIRKNGRLFE